MTSLGDYKVHPIAAMFPLMEGDEFTQLVADIKQNGLVEPILLTADGDTIIDGRNRWRACERALVDPAFKRLGKHYSELDIIHLIISKNLARRHLNPGQRGMLVLKIAPTYEKAAKERQLSGLKKGQQRPVPQNSAERKGEARDQLAALAGVSHDTIARSKKVAETSSRLANEVTSGKKKH